MGRSVDKVNKAVYRDYPIYKGVKPKVSKQVDGMLLVYDTNEKTADGQNLPMQLRVKADNDGNIRSVAGSR